MCKKNYRKQSPTEKSNKNIRGCFLQKGKKTPTTGQRQVEVDFFTPFNKRWKPHRID